MDPFSAPSDTRKRLGTALRHARAEAGLSGPELADRIGISQSRLSRYERGVQAAPTEVVDRWAHITGLPQTELAGLRELAEVAGTEVVSWRRAMARGGLGRIQHDWRELLASAATVRSFHTVLVPGLLQVPEYARQVFAADPGNDEPGIAAAVAARMNNQTILYEPHRTFEIVLSESVLRWRVGSTEVMQAQLDRIAAATSLKNVAIGVLPFTSDLRCWREHEFNLLADRDGAEPDVVHVETLTTSLTITDAADVQRYREVFSCLQEAALTGREARELIQRAGQGSP